MERDQNAARMTTAELIDRLREIDPAGERTVFMESGREERMDTDPVKAIYVEDGNGLWDKDRLRLVLTNDPEDHRV